MVPTHSLLRNASKVLLGVVLGILLALANPVSADTDLTALVNAVYPDRTEDAALHDLAHQRAQYQVTCSGGICSASALTHDGLTTAEVLACNYVGPEHAVEQWQGSPAHHELLSDPAYDLIGCGSAQGIDGAWFFACLLVAGEPVEVTPNPTPVGSIPTAGPVLLPNTAMR